MSNQSLRGLTIAVTRPRDQAAQLAQRIEQVGGTPLLFPLLDIAAVQDIKALHEQISRLGKVDLAIFISPNAVRYGIAAIRATGVLSHLPNQLLPPWRGKVGMGVEPCGIETSTTSLALPLQEGGELKIATVGQGSAKALRELGITNVIAPTERFDSEGLLALPELQNVAGWRVMIFRGDGGRELLGDTFKARGATVEYVTCYQRSKPHLDVQLLLKAKPDAISVSSSEALGYLWQTLDSNARAALRGTSLFVPHERIAVLAREQGWQHVHLTGSGDDGLVSALMAWSSEN